MLALFLMLALKQFKKRRQKNIAEKESKIVLDNLGLLSKKFCRKNEKKCWWVDSFRLDLFRLKKIYQC
jgi:hypothetical protein